MRVVQLIPDLSVPDIPAVRGFYEDYLGLVGEELGLDWVTRFVVLGDGSASQALQVVTTDAHAPVNPALTVAVDDVDAAYAQAPALGYEIVHPLTTPPWGKRRFFVRDPAGNVLNIAQHRD